MSHLVETMAYAGELPWHGLGYAVSNDLTPEQMMIAAKCDWEVAKVPAMAMIDGEYRDTGKCALYRKSDNKVLDVISADWNPTQNAEAFQFFKEFTDAGQMNMETAGSLDGGKNVWALARINMDFEAVRGDVIKGFLLFSNPHKYGRGITIRFTPIRVVCNNTLTFALEGRKNTDMSVSVNHRRAFDAEQVKEALGIAQHKLEDYKETAVYLASKRFDAQSLLAYINEVFPTASDTKERSKPAETALSALNNQPGLQFAEGSWWHAFNTITYVTDHKLGRSADTRLNSAWFGINKDRKIKALNLAVKYAEAA